MRYEGIAVGGPKDGDFLSANLDIISIPLPPKKRDVAYIDKDGIHIIEQSPDVVQYRWEHAYPGLEGRWIYMPYKFGSRSYIKPDPSGLM